MGTLRKVFETPVQPDGTYTRVYRDSEWNEFRTRTYFEGVLHPESDYFTHDKQDAIHTAIAIAYAWDECTDGAENGYGAGFKTLELAQHSYELDVVLGSRAAMLAGLAGTDFDEHAFNLHYDPKA